MATSNPQNNYVSLVTPDTTVKREAGWCLSHTQAVFKAPVMYPSATAAANATTQRVDSRIMPNVAVPVWFDHWGTYQGRYDNWGHVVAWIPGHGVLSSPTSGYGQQWYPSIEAVERAFNAKFRFWSLDINTLLVAKKEPAKAESKDIEMRTLFNTQDRNEETRRAVIGEFTFHVQGAGASALERKFWGSPVNVTQSEWDNELKMVNARRALVGLFPLKGVRGESGTIKVKGA